MSTVRKKRAPGGAPDDAPPAMPRRRRKATPDDAELPPAPAPEVPEASPMPPPDAEPAAVAFAPAEPATESNDFDGAPPTALSRSDLPTAAKTVLAFRATDADVSDSTMSAAALSEPVRRQMPALGAGAAPSIDELLVRAAPRRATTKQSGVVMAASVADVLDTTPLTRIRNVDDFVEQVLQMVSVERVPDELLADPVVVVGLSQDEPNPAWTALADQRAMLEERATFLLRERKAVQNMHRRGAEDSAMREALLQRTSGFQEPLDAIKLIKPPRVAQRVTEYWRALLGVKLKELNGSFRTTTAQMLIESATKAANVPDLLEKEKEPYELRARTYVQHAVNPVLNDAIRQLQTATYEDLPLTRELLGELFDEFFDRLLDTLLRDGDRNELDAVQEQQAAEAAQVPLEGESVLARRADALLAKAIGRMESGFAELQSVVDADDRELYERLSYLRQVVYIYADGTFYGFFESWREAASRRIGGQAVLLSSLERVLSNIIETRRRALQRADDRAARAASDYAIPRQAAMVKLYGEYILRQIAAHRTQAVLQQNDDDDLRRALDAAFDAPKEQWAAANFLGIKLLVHPRIDRFALLDVVYDEQRAQIAERFGAADAAAAETAQLDQRKEALRKLLSEWSPIVAPAVRAHGAGDDTDNDDLVGDPYWSPFNLAYPLTLEYVDAQAEELRSYVKYYATIFDADAVHSRNIALRSVLTVGYADQLVQRELMRIDFALRELVQRVRAVPLEIVLPIESAATPLELRAQITLRPELAYVMQAPSAALRDPKVVDLASNLGDADFEVFWWFQPTLDPNTGRASGGLQRQLLARQTLLRTGDWTARVASLRVDHAGGAAGCAGLYWAEFTQVGGDGGRWRSKFTARVRITARCTRDDVVYELGTEHFGGCQWSEHAREPELTAAIEEWRTLVERGPDAHSRLLAERKSDRLASERAGMDESASALLYLPPWGREDELSLMGAVARLQESDEAFSYHAIVARIANRIASQLRALPGAGTGTLGGERSDAELLLLLADTSVDESAGDWFVLQTLFAEHTTVGTFLEPTTRNHDAQSPAPPLAYEGTLTERLRDARARRLVLPLLQRTGDSLPALTSALPRSFVTLPRFGEHMLTAARMPLASMLCLITTPLIWQNLTRRERHFFEQLRTRFDYFTLKLANLWGTELRAAVLAADQPWWRLHGGAKGAEALQHELWRRLALITPDSLEFDGGAGTSDMLVDRALRSEFDDLVHRRLVRTGLVTLHETRVRDPATGILRTQQWLAPTREAESTLLAVHRPLGGSRQMWLDAHTHETNQPSAYRIEIGNTAYIYRGSEPCGKHYDFDGLHRAITALAARYNELTPNVAVSPVAFDEQTRLRQLLGDAEVLYNYLAFVAGAPSNRSMLTGAQLFALLTAEDARNFFVQVRQQRVRLGSIAAAGGALTLQAVDT